MGYECPVCEAPQADARHLADHLAMTAMVRGGDHEAFLDERVDDWAEMGPDELGAILVEYATEREYPQVFEDTTGHDHDSGTTFEDHVATAGRRGPGRGDPTGGHEEVLQEAREMTEQMIGTAGDEDETAYSESNGTDDEREESASGTEESDDE